MSDEIKQIVDNDTLLIYSDFNKGFDIHAYTSKLQLVAVIIQDSNQSPSTAID